MIETMTHPTVSSIMAEAISVIPTFRRIKPISRTTIATIFSEAIDNAVPRNSEVMIRWSGFGNIAAGNSSPSANPQEKGTAIPAIDALMAARPACLTSLRSVSIPVSSNSIRMPNCESHRSCFSVADLRRRLRVVLRARSRPIRKAQAEFRRSAAHNGRLPDPLHRLAHQTSYQEQQNDLREGKRSDGACIRVLCGERAVVLDDVFQPPGESLTSLRADGYGRSIRCLYHKPNSSGV